MGGVPLPPSPIDAKDIPNNGTPHKGNVVLLNYNGIGHAALILEMYPGGFYVRETNFEKCRQTERLIEFDDPAIRGFFSPSE